MPDNHPREDHGGVALAFQALLYASGEMDGPEAAAFEARLGEDQAAREALCQAVQTTHPRAALGGLRPDPGYREQVRQRLQPRHGLWNWLTGKRFYHGHPLVWGGLGALAAVMVTLAVSRGSLPDTPSRHPAANAAGSPGPQATAPAAKHPAAMPQGSPEKAPASLPSPADATASDAEARAWVELRHSGAWRKRLLAGRGGKH